MRASGKAERPNDVSASEVSRQEPPSPAKAGNLAAGSRRASAHSWVGGDERICPKHLKRAYHHQRDYHNHYSVLTVVTDPPPIEI